ncbi:hypothetical protein L1887_48082 [Cichorium endivia]|nr:hypothetical protein L1887_48082 [Cichorium endivia]
MTGEQQVAPEANEWDRDSDIHDEDMEEEILEGDLSDEDDADAYFRDVASRPRAPTQPSTLAARRGAWSTPSGYVMRIRASTTKLHAPSSSPRARSQHHRKYSGPYDALQKTLREEGRLEDGIPPPESAHPNHPRLYAASAALARCASADRAHAAPRAEHAPHQLRRRELAISTASLCITLPIETVRRRLQLQMRKPYGAKDAEASSAASSRKITSATLQQQSSTAGSPGRIALTTGNISVRGPAHVRRNAALPYVGVVEAIYRIVTEEDCRHAHAFRQARPDFGVGHQGNGRQRVRCRSASDSNAMAQSAILADKTGHSSLGGLRSLYRGFSMAFSANLVVFMLTIVSGERAGPAGWAEI